VTINPAVVEYETAGRRYTHFDCPGIIHVINGFLAVAARIDAAVLVVAADEGPMPQTREQLLIARQSGVSRVVVFLNKTDAVDDPELIELVEMEVRGLLHRYGFPGDDAPVVCGNALAAMQAGGATTRPPRASTGCLLP
jgi:elongation factor Tu